MNLTRRNFIKLAILSASALPLVTLSSCYNKGIGNLSYDELKDEKDKYKIIVYNIDSSDITGKLRDLDYEVISKLEGKRVMLVYEYTYMYYCGSESTIYMWKKEGDKLRLTELCTSIDEAWEQFRNKFSIIEELDAFSVFIDEYGVKKEYTCDEIQNILDKCEENIDSKTYQKTLE